MPSYENLQILAESSQRISSELKDRFPQVEWRTIAAFRNVAVHDYLGVDVIQIWKIVKEDLPVLKKAVNDILKYLNQNTKSDH